MSHTFLWIECVKHFLKKGPRNRNAAFQMKSEN